MRVLYWHQYFRLPHEGGARRSFYLSRCLSAHVQQVEVIAAHKYRQLLRLSPRWLVRRTAVAYNNQMSWYRRLWAFIQYAMGCLCYGLYRRYDWLYATSTPLSTGIAACWLSWLRRRPYVFEVRDLWPEIPFALGFLRRFSLLRQFIYWQTSITYRKARLIVVVSPSMKAYVRRQYRPRQIVTIPNMPDKAFFDIAAAPPSTILRMVYTGSAGVANHLIQMLEWINLLPEAYKAVIRLDLLCEGKQQQELQTYTTTHQLDTLVHFLPYGNQQSVMEALQQCDVFWVCFAQIPFIDMGSPNKFFEGLAAGRICFTTLDGWTRHLVERYQCGFYIHDTSSLLAAIQHLQTAERRLYMQQQARWLASRLFDPERLQKKWLNALQQAGLLIDPNEAIA